MANVLRHQFGLRRVLSTCGAREKSGRIRGESGRRKLWLLTAAVLLAPLVLAQGSPRVTGLDPSSGKVNDSVTVTGENLGKGTVSAVYLSDDKSDYKATLVEQSADKIVAKVPHVKAGNYNLSIQVGNNIYIQPVRFEVQE